MTKEKQEINYDTTFICLKLKNWLKEEEEEEKEEEEEEKEKEKEKEKDEKNFSIIIQLSF